MHPLKLERFLTQPRTTTNSVIKAPQGQSICFIIDQSRQPRTLERLYGLGQPLEQDSLFRGTEFESLNDLGPIWLSAPESPELSQLAADLCLERNAGICVLTEDLQQAKEHARWLLKANDSSGGQSLLSYYRPSLWTAMALTSESQLRQLMGPWLSVFSPAPKHFGAGPSQWMGWCSERGVLAAERPTSFTLPEGGATTQRDIGWIYWVDEHHESFGEPSEEELDVIISNLAFLAEHRITQGRHLLRLGHLLSRAPLDVQPEVLKILAANEAPFVKVKKLETLPADSMIGAATGKEEWSHHGTW